MPAPSFLCVGMPKCGTSTLHHVLAQQKGLFVPPVKEIQFLASVKLQYSGSLYELFLTRHWAARQDRLALARVIKGSCLRKRSMQDVIWLLRYAFARRDMNWYYSLFPDGSICGDISPIYYILERQEIHTISSIMPALKIIILLRSPLQQIWSHCRMVVVRLNKQTGSEAFKDHIEKLTLARPTYRGLVEDWASEFGGQVLVGYLEDMAANPAHFFATLFQFLGLETEEEWIASDPFIVRARSHVGIPYDVPEDVRATLADHASARLEGFDAIAPHRAAQWRAELEDFRRTEPKPKGSNPDFSVRPDGAHHQWRKVPPRQLSV